MSKSKSSSIGKIFLGSFRYTVKFMERLFQNLILQFKWIWRSGNNIHVNIVSWHGRNFPTHLSWKYIYGILITILMILIVLPFLVL